METTRRQQTKAISLTAFFSVLASLAMAQDTSFMQVPNTGDLGIDFSDYGISWGDYDGDGDMDVFTTSSLQRSNVVYRNEGGGSFTRMTSADIGELGSDKGDTSMGLWVDIENDGDLDLYVANYSEAKVPSDYNNLSLLPQVDRLYLNDGSGRFSTSPSVTFDGITQFANGVSMADYNADGWLDVFVATWPLHDISRPDVLFRQDASMTFHSVDGLSVNTEATSGSWADYDGDGDLDLFVANVDHTPSVIYVNQQGESGASEFTAARVSLNGDALPHSLCGAWGDYDNNGKLDLLLPDNRTGLNLIPNYHESMRHIDLNGGKGAHGAIWVDVQNDGHLDILLSATPGPSNAGGSAGFLLLTNNGNSGFVEQTLVEYSALGQLHRGPAVADFNNDGFMDFYILLANTRDRLMQNQGNQNHWLKLDLKGTQSNASAIGALVRVRATIGGESVWQMRKVTAGGDTLFVQHDIRPNFGLRDALVAEIVRIEWPSGTVQELTDVAADQILHVIEPPRLRVETGGRISWPVTAEVFQLERAASMEGTWSAATETVVTNGTRITVTTEPDGESKFYRLVKP